MEGEGIKMLWNNYLYNIIENPVKNTNYIQSD